MLSFSGFLWISIQQMPLNSNNNAMYPLKINISNVAARQNVQTISNIIIGYNCKPPGKWLILPDSYYLLAAILHDDDISLFIVDTCTAESQDSHPECVRSDIVFPVIKAPEDNFSQEHKHYKVIHVYNGIVSYHCFSLMYIMNQILSNIKLVYYHIKQGS